LNWQQLPSSPPLATKRHHLGDSRLRPGINMAGMTCNSHRTCPELCTDLQVPNHPGRVPRGLTHCLANTHFLSCIHIGTLVQQQGHHILVTLLSCQMKGCPLILQSRCVAGSQPQVGKLVTIEGVVTGSCCQSCQVYPSPRITQLNAAWCLIDFKAAAT
jgi:hypothetical protein